jgi:hypothetical protein
MEGWKRALTVVGHRKAIHEYHANAQISEVLVFSCPKVRRLISQTDRRAGKGLPTQSRGNIERTPGVSEIYIW